MSFTAEGTIEIDMADFTTWLYENYLPTKSVEFQLGVPRMNKANMTLDVDFAMSTDCNPKDQFEKPDVIKQWEDLK